MISAQYVDGLELRIREKAARIAELEAELADVELIGRAAIADLEAKLTALRKRIDEAPVVAWVDYQAGWNGTVINLNVRGRGKPLISKEDLA